MRTIVRASVVAVMLAVVVCFTVGPVAQSAIYSTPVYNIYYYNSMQYRWVRGLAPYLGRAFWAARTTIGIDARLGKMNIHFSSAKNGLGWMYAGRQDIYLSVPYFISYYKWGSVVAHESAHVLFYNYTRAHLWNSGLIHYRTFFTESLSWYAGNYVYNYFRYTSSSAYSEIRAHLKYYAGKTRYAMSWCASGYYYRYGSGNMLNQAFWSLCASGWYLTGGRLTSTNWHLGKTLYLMRYCTSYYGQNLRSSDYYTARSIFENAFLFGYGLRANAGWIYAGSANAAYKNTRYLYGIFWYLFYS